MSSWSTRAGAFLHASLRVFASTGHGPWRRLRGARIAEAGRSRCAAACCLGAADGGQHGRCSHGDRELPRRVHSGTRPPAAGVGPSREQGRRSGGRAEAEAGAGAGAGGLGGGGACRGVERCGAGGGLRGVQRRALRAHVRQGEAEARAFCGAQLPRRPRPRRGGRWRRRRRRGRRRAGQAGPAESGRGCRPERCAG